MLLLAFASVAVAAAFLVFGSASALADPGRGWRALLDWSRGTDADPTGRALLAMRFWRCATGAGVGAALAFAGALLQGLFRNPLASPSVLGITTGASVGAAGAIACAGLFGLALPASGVASPVGAWLVPLFAFAGALGVGIVVHSIAAARGHLSVPALLLVGLASNTFLGGLLSLLQQLMLERWDAMRSILAWSFGTLVDRGPWHALVVLVLALPCIALGTRVGWELDLLQAGEEDARQLGVDTARVRRVAFVTATLATSAAVAVAGQIAFVGLIVPHLVRLCGVREHRALLLVSALAGAVFLPAADLAQIVALDDALAPGVVMSLLGGPFFVWLLWRERRAIARW